MPSKYRRKVFLAALLAVSAVVWASCRKPQPPLPSGRPQGPAETVELSSPAPETHPDEPLLADFNRGAALMEQYRYSAAAEAFEKVVQAKPEWAAARFNLALAYLNMQGERDAKESLDIARDHFAKILEVTPDHTAALFCLGMYYQYLGETERALEYFSAAHEQDPADPHTTYKLAEVTLAVGKEEQGRAMLEELVDNNPGFLSALYRLAMQYQRSGQTEKAKQLIERFKRLQDSELAGGSFAVQTSYGAAGRYYRILGADSLPIERQTQADPQRLVFSPEVRRLGPKLQAWKWSGGRVLLPGIAVADVDRDGDLDVFVTGQQPEAPQGEQPAEPATPPADALLDAPPRAGEDAGFWINDGAGHFTAGQSFSAAGVSPCFGDVDNDGDVDLWLGCAASDQLLIQDDQGKFNSANQDSLSGPATLTRLARLVDLDSDGDLDLAAFRYATGDVPAASAGQPAASSIFRSNRDGSYSDLAEAMGLRLADVALAGALFDDLDNDYDLDLLLLPNSGPPRVWLNDRAGAGRMIEGPSLGLDAEDVASAVSGDPDKDGDRDILLFAKSGLLLMVNDGHGRFAADEAFNAQFGRLGGSGGQFADMDNDGDLDIVLGDARRRDGTRGPAILINQWRQNRFMDAAELDPGLLLAAIETGADASCVVADFTADGRCDILLAAIGQRLQLVENLTDGGNWIELDLAGTRPSDNKARSNRSAIGARVEIKTADVFQQYVVGGSSGSLAMPPLRIHAGLGRQYKIEWLRVIWPDAVLQAEMELPAQRVTVIEELNRKTSSCPYLFAWTGDQFEFVGDFGGVGGLGYLLRPGVYAPPDPTEYLPLPDLQPQQGDYVLQAITPLEEVTYFDEAKLIAIDHPLGTTVYPDEMMAVSLAPPEFELFCFRQPIEPQAAIDHRGADVAAELRAVDRRCAGATQPDHRFTGLAAEHWIELDFGDQLAQLGGGDRLILVAHGWVEYGYSSTNYAASQADLSCRAPSIEVYRGGRWVELIREAGYPAGVNHVMTLELTEYVEPGDARFRISSNMELYWDRMFLAVPEPAAVQMREAAVRSADLHFLGYPREYSPDGRGPNLCDYGNVDRSAAWKLMAGDYTRYGEVGELLAAADDCFAIMGHGEEITLRFAADDFGAVPAGCRRSFLLKTDSFCKDMDLYTAHPDSVEPLPFHGMSGYPYGAGESYPDTPATRDYRQRYNTRRVLAR